jgi:hypothetical protein
MDWGLLRSNEKGKKFLRPKFLFPKWFYYYAIITNFFLRFAWVLALIKIYPNWVNESQLIIFIMCIAEGFRRA